MPKKISTFDIVLPLIPILLLAISIAVIYSLVFGGAESNLVIKQGISALIGVIAMIALSFFDYRFFRSVAWIFYVVVILLLVYVDFFGLAAGGAVRWIDLGVFQLQPSELAKVAIILGLSAFFSSRIDKISWKSIFLSLLIVIPPLALILKEPDLGTALVVMFVYIVILFSARPKKSQTIVVLSTILLGSLIVIASAYNVKPFNRLLHDYQRNRILTFVDPSLDPYGKGYNVLQAKIAVGAGGILGRGLGKGSQSQLQYLPKPQTDFIFSGIAESFGFVGVFIILALFLSLILKIVNIGAMAQDNFGMLVCFGAAGMFIFQVLVNVGMNVGLAPVTGIPLPFCSYGGSALIAYMFLIGLVEAVYIRHKKISF